MLGIGGGHLAHRRQQTPELVAMLGRRATEVGTPGGVEEGEGEVGLVDPVGGLVAIDGDGEGLRFLGGV